MPQDINALLKLMVDKGASDLHITANWPAHIRIDEKLIAVDDRVLSADEAKDVIYSLLATMQSLENINSSMLGN